jgi:Family of unknown function (DUF6152)
MRGWIGFGLTLLSSLALSSAAGAHHSYTVLFDPSKNITVSGEVTRFEFKAPHAYIYLNVAADDGTSTEWELETTSPGQLIRKGVTPETLHVGDTVSVFGNPSRDGRNLVRVIRLTMADGEEKQLQ